MICGGAVIGLGLKKKDPKGWACYIIAFGLGMILACIFPAWLILFLAAVILVMLGVTLFKC